MSMTVRMTNITDILSNGTPKSGQYVLLRPTYGGKAYDAFNGVRTEKKEAFLKPRGGSTEVTSGPLSGLGSIASRRIEWHERGTTADELTGAATPSAKPSSQKLAKLQTEMHRALLQIMEFNKGQTTKIQAYGNSVTVLAGNGNEIIRTLGNAVIHAGGGDDDVCAQEKSLVFGGDGSDAISTHANSVASGGNGNDWIETYSGSLLAGGAGDDILDGHCGCTLVGGTGDDLIEGNDDTIAQGGDGNDIIQVGIRSLVDGGAGDDVIGGARDAHILGGSGDDHIVGGSRLEGGEGHDILDADLTGDVYPVEMVGGKGDDLIIAKEGTTVFYEAGDGFDTIGVGNASTTIRLGAGISRENVQVTALDDRGALHITLGTEGDGLLILRRTTSTQAEQLQTPDYLHYPRGAVDLIFQDGQQLTLEAFAGRRREPALNRVV